MQIDTFMTIGKNHKVCEDYILSGTNPIPYIIISDGCSSSKGSDMGARLLCFLAQQYIKFRQPQTEKFAPDHNEMGLWIIHNAELVGKQLGLPKNSLDATLIIAYKAFNYDNCVRVHLYGDGCIVHFGPEFLNIKIIEYSKNAPYYLSYKIDIERNLLYHQMLQEKFIKTYSSEQSDSSLERFHYDIPFTFHYNLGVEKNGLLIASDGLASFFRFNSSIISFPAYVENFFAFKTTKGEFLKRRANKELKTLAKEGIYNADDLSIGAFLLEE